MITNFKIFEEVNEFELEIGDYVIAYPIFAVAEIGKLLNKEIGQLIKIIDKSDFIYEIKYFLNSEELKFLHRQGFDTESNSVSVGMSLVEIKHWSKNKEDLEQILTANKYNL